MLRKELTGQLGALKGTRPAQVHAGSDNVPVALLLHMMNLSQVRVGGDDAYEGQRQQLRIFNGSRDVTKARDTSFDLFQTAVAAATAYARGQDGLGNVSIEDVWKKALEDVHYSRDSQAWLLWHQKVSYEQEISHESHESHESHRNQKDLSLIAQDSGAKMAKLSHFAAPVAQLSFNPCLSCWQIAEEQALCHTLRTLSVKLFFF